MDINLTADDFPDVDNVGELIAELEAYLSLHYPCLADLAIDKIVLLQAILRPVIRRWGELGTGVGQAWVAGPFQGRSQTGAHTLEPIEIASLRALCAAPARIAGLPVGSSPEPEQIDDLFVRRPGWPAADGRQW